MIIRIILLQIMLLLWSNSYAQQSNNANLKLEGGPLWDAVDGKAYFSGLALNIEPKLRVSKNTVLGLRLGGALNTQIILSSDPRQFYIDNEVGSNGVISLGPTFDYYFSRSSSNPYIGMGLMHSFLSTNKKGLNIDEFFDGQELVVDNKLGFMFRTGVNLHNVVIGRSDLSRVIVGLAFNYIPKADVKMLNGQNLGTIASSNVTLTVGHILGDVTN